MSYFRKLLDWITTDWEQLRTYNYYAASSDLTDLERRMRQVERGQAPWQRNGKYNARGMM